MKILGNRVLVSKVEDPKVDGYQEVNIQDTAHYKGRVKQIGGFPEVSPVNIGDIILFARNSPDTQDVDHEDKKMKVVSFDDIIAIL